MIEIHVSPTGVKEVIFRSHSLLEEDLEFASWQIIRSLVNKADRRLRKVAIDFRKEKLPRKIDSPVAHWENRAEAISTVPGIFKETSGREER
jgi:hypothetical protein